MKLIENWRRAHRMLSVQMGSLLVAWGMTPPDTQAVIMGFVGLPAERVPAVLGLLVILGRVVAQKSTKP